MIEFDEDFLVKHKILDRDEAISFCKFLFAEKIRHTKDIKKIENSIDYLEDKFKFKINKIKTL